MYLTPADHDPVKIADWAELEVLYSKTGIISFDAIRARIDIDGSAVEGLEPQEEESYEAETEGEPHEAVGQELAEVLVANAIAEIDRRIHIAQEAYPFERSRRTLSLKLTYRKCIPYIFCLLVADRVFYSPRDKVHTRLFEHLAKEALAEYMGGEAVRFGAPRDTMARGINDAIDELAMVIGDERINQYPVNATDKDLGLDVAGWRTFPDRRISKLEIFIQCATGEDWEENKGEECNLGIWQSILCCSNDRMRGLAIPYIVADEVEWRRAAWTLIFLDRLRIASVLRSKPIPDNEYHWWRWCRKRIGRGRKSG